jgi:transcriptional regulator with PAS, ATPase and Fis domain
MPAETMIQADIRKIFVDLDFEIGEEDYSHKSNLFFADSVANVEGRRIHCAVNLVPIANENGMAGFHISFSKSKELHRKVNKVAGNMAIYQFEDIIGESKSLQKVIASARKIAKTRSNVLIEGESGTGKELFAQSIHNHSSRKAGPFVAINCASLPRELIESELFGYEKGAFTGALKDGKIGKFELAEGGTIFLDEIGELPIEVQAKLLRVLDNFTIRRIGSNYEKKLDVRIIAATNRDLLAEVEKKNFRHDLYYRLNVFKLELPALRDRENDVEICAKYFLAKLNDQNRYGVKIFSSGFYQAIRSYKWVGNIRELQNIVERAYYLCEGKLITPEHLPDSIVDHQEVRSQASYHEEPGQDRSWILDVKNVERNNIVNMLIQCDKNVLEAAKQLSISKSTIYRKISKYGIDLKKL